MIGVFLQPRQISFGFIFRTGRGSSMAPQLCFAPGIPQRRQIPYLELQRSFKCRSSIFIARAAFQSVPRCAISSPLVTTYPSTSNTTNTSRYILLVLQNTFRTSFNPALNLAVDRANIAQAPLIAVTTISDIYPKLGRTIRHRKFLLDGLGELCDNLRQLGVPYIVRKGDVVQGVDHYASLAKEVVIDVGYLREERAWRNEIRKRLKCTVYEVETNVLVPVRMALDQQAYGARMIRTNIWEQVPLLLKKARRSSENLIQQQTSVDGLGLCFSEDEVVLDNGNSHWDMDEVLNRLDNDKSVPIVAETTGGYSAANERLKEFLDNRLEDYAELRNNPSANKTSCLSPYLHFGFISPVEVFTATLGNLEEIYPPIDENDMPYQGSLDKIADELVVRRELAINFVYYNDKYDSFECLPEWAHTTLASHLTDNRPVKRTMQELENAETEDPYWNAAQTELLDFGRIHQHMRKYWGKRILEWSATPETAYETLVFLNNKYALDGSDANSFAGIGWIFGLHDRKHAERDIYGKVRSMSQKALTKRFFRSIDDYVKIVSARNKGPAKELSRSFR